MAQRENPSGRTYGGETQAERKARRRARLLEAGLRVFGGGGYRQATVRQLCREAELTDRYFYEEFGSMEELLVAVYLECVARIRHDVLASLTGPGQGSVEVLIRGALDAFFTSIEDARLARIVWIEVLGVSARVDQTYTACVRDFAELLMRLAQVVHPDVDRGLDVHRIAAVSLIGAVSEAAKQWLLAGYHEPREVMIDATAPLFLGMTQYLAQTTSPR